MLWSKLTTYEPAHGHKQPATVEGDDENERRSVEDVEIADALERNGKRMSAKGLNNFTDTVQYVVQHGFISTIFVLKLCARPLVYVTQTFAVPSDRWGTRKYQFLHNSNPEEQYHQEAQDATTRHLSPTWLSYIVHFITSHFRMAQALYRLCSLLEDDPDILSRARAWDPWEIERTELQNLQCSHPVQEAETPNITNQPAIASQIYHAALTDKDELDDVLDAFEVGHSSHGSPTEAEPNNETESLPRSHRHHASTSIQTTPTEMIRSKEPVLQTPNITMVRLHSEGFASFEIDDQAEIGPAEIPPPLTSKKPYKGWSSLDRVEEQRHMSLPEPCTGGRDIEGVLGITDDLERCSTYTRRQRRSMLPRRLGTRSETQLQHYPAAGSKGTLSSMPCVAPKKRNRLQRKMKRV